MKTKLFEEETAQVAQEDEDLVASTFASVAQKDQAAAAEPKTAGLDADGTDQGVVRKVKNAQLVSKKQAPDGTYTELWVMNVGRQTMRDEMVIKNDILAATDIPKGSRRSVDGTQSYEIWSIGNVQMVRITGLPQ